MPRSVEPNTRTLPLDNDDLPAIFRSADTEAVREQRITIRWGAIQLTLLTTSPALNAIPLNTHGIHVGALAAGFALALALLAAAWPVLGQSQHRWYRHRALAESVRALAWKYSARARGFVDDDTAEGELEWRLTSLLRMTHEVAIAVETPDPLGLTTRMRELRAAPLSLRRDTYIAARLDQQWRWYTARSRRCITLSRRWLAVAIIAMLIGLTGSFVYALGLWDVNLLDFAAALTASVVAWTRLKQFQPLADAYTVTAQELALVRARIRDTAVDEASWADLCDEAENIVSREHTMWIARKGGE